jgi:1-phosphofructokinase family hexose kinase
LHSDSFYVTIGTLAKHAGVTVPVLCITPNPAIDRTLTVDQFQTDEVNRARSARCAAGGKGVNVARAMRGLGLPVLCAGMVGGLQGMLFAELARREQLAGRWTAIDGETRVCTILIDPAQKHNTVVNEPGPLISEQEWWRFHADSMEAAAQASAVCVCGSAPPGVSPGSYRALLEALAVEGRPVWADTSGGFLAAAAATTDVHLKINLVEAAALVGSVLTTADDALQAAATLGRGNRRTVVITLGAEGAVLVSEHGRWHARPPAITRVNAVGSGDSLLAGLVTGLEKGLDHRTALAWGVAAGAANAAGSGGASFTRAQFDQALAGVQVTDAA